MFFPIGDDQVAGGHKPLLSYSIIGINLLIFFFELNLGQDSELVFLNNYGAIPDEIINGQDLYTLFSCMFIHGGWMHLIGNMLFLWVFADNIEAVIGTFNFLLFYLLGGLIASIVHIFFNPFSKIPMVGASGAISSVLGAYMVMFPASRIKVLFLLFFSVFYVPSFFFLGIWIVQQLIAGVGSINAVAQEASGIAWWAHIGGFSYGVLAGFMIRSNYKNRYIYKAFDDSVSET